jgi:hypothetical protein
MRSLKMENQVAVAIPRREGRTGLFASDREEVFKISLLTNTIDYFLGSVFIIKSGSCYRLVVMHNGRVLVDEKYRTARGGKIAFYRFYRDRAWKLGVRPRWSPFFNPDVEFIDGSGRRVMQQKKEPFH